MLMGSVFKFEFLEQLFSATYLCVAECKGMHMGEFLQPNVDGSASNHACSRADEQSWMKLSHGRHRSYPPWHSAEAALV